MGILTSYLPSISVENRPTGRVKLSVYNSGTETLSALYGDSGLTETIPNPMTSDLFARFGLAYVVDGTYRVVARSKTGKVVYDIDPITVREDILLDNVSEFRSVGHLVADNVLTYEGATGNYPVQPGDVLSVSGSSHSYKVAEPDAEDYHLQTDGGVKVYALPTDEGQYAVESFGAIVDGITDDSAAFQTAIDAIVAGGGGTLTWSGMAQIGSTIDASGWSGDIVLRGRSAGSGLVTASSDISIIKGAPSVPPSITLREINIIGPWSHTPKQMPDDNWLFHVEPCAKLIIENCRIGSSQKGAVKAANSGSFRMTGSEIYECARGGVNVSNTPETFIVGNIFRNLQDDAISLHTSSSALAPSEKHVVSNNGLIDCQGIGALGTSNIVVQGNWGKRIRSRFFIGGYDASFDEGAASAVNVLIADNVVEDMLNFRQITGQGTLNTAISIRPYRLSDGGVLAAAPGENVTSTGGVTPPWGNYRGIGNTAAIAGYWGIRVLNNTFLRTQKAVANYSDWGVGLFFEQGGYIDPPITDSDMATGWAFGSGLRDLLVSGNLTSGMTDLRFHFGNDFGFRRCRFSNNTWAQSLASAMVTFGGSSNNNLLDVTFDGDTFDGDPFYAHPSRGTNGSWGADNDMTVFNLVNCPGWQANNSHFRNVSRVVNTGGSNVYSLQSCYQYGIFHATGFSSANCGIGNPLDLPSVIHVAWEADSASDDWGRILRQGDSANSVPTSGNWLRGMLVRSQGSESYVPDENGRLLIGWRRATNCNLANSNHVEGVDWIPVYAGTTAYPSVPAYTVATLPGAATRPNGLAQVTNEVGGATLAVSDGSTWRRVRDGNPVSAT